MNRILSTVRDVTVWVIVGVILMVTKKGKVKP